jgi:hypothetical protein
MGTTGECWIAKGSGGFVTFPPWRDDVLIVPIAASATIPGLGLTIPMPASIMRGGMLRVALPRTTSQAASIGDYEVLWELTTSVDANYLDQAAEPLTQTLEVTSTLHLVAAADVPALSAAWTDTFGVPTPAYMRQKQLFGVPFIDGNGLLLPDDAVQLVIDGSRAYIENMCNLVIGKRLVTSLIDPSAPTLPLANPNNLPVVTEDGYDFTAQRMTQSASFIQLRHRPIAAIHRMDLYLGTLMQMTIPPDWLIIQHDAGTVQLLPSAKAQLTVQGLYVPLLAAAAPDRAIPSMFRFAYEAGQAITPDLFEVVSWIAARQLLIIISDAILGGIASSSVSVDGISQSLQTTSSPENSTYGANISELTKRINEWIKNTLTTYRGIVMGG